MPMPRWRCRVFQMALYALFQECEIKSNQPEVKFTGSYKVWVVATKQRRRTCHD